MSLLDLFLLLVFVCWTLASVAMLADFRGVRTSFSRSRARNDPYAIRHRSKILVAFSWGGVVTGVYGMVGVLYVALT
ncbi:hypothetical protein [Streptomyces sp. CBMA152]|uniref:hypothetical protein n=1 Tax=Streptomyces sp. CBMA152 TaxID=1896312 RepID=UPI0016608320|nr:hypothetical protein [Streptomyces sp. CBMA152]MBD0744974.1 hypothetical protein [Streptomyces sp. CBMA152]